jgi:hypothetical protein
MAFKEFKVKVGVDGTEVNTAITTLEGFTNQIGALREKLAAAPIGSKEFKELEKEISRTEKAFGKAQNSGKGWLDTMASAPGLVGTLGQSIQGTGKLFDSFNNALKTSLIGFIAAAVIELVQQFKKMEGVMDPINKITSIFSGLMSKLANTVLPIVIAPIELLVKGLEMLANAFDDAGDAMSDLADRQDELSDSEATYQLALSKSNRALAEARERAQDSTLSIQERKQALQDADALERKIAAEGKARALEQARITAGNLAVTLGVSKERIDAIKKYDAAQLESFAAEIAQRKGLNQEQRTQLLQQLAITQEIDANTAKIGKKTASAIKAIDNEAAAAGKEAAQKRLEAQKNELNAQIELEKNKANTDEKLLKELLEKKDALENKGTKKSKAELDLQQQNRDKAIKDAVKSDTDAAEAKAKKDKEDQQKLDDEYIKSVKQKDANEIAAAEILLEEKKRLYKEDSKEFRDQQNVIFALRQKAIADEIEAIGKKKDQTDADKQRLIDLGLENQKLTNQIISNNQAQVDSDKKKLEDQQNAKLKNDMDALEYELQKTETDYARKLEILDAENTLLKEDYDKKIALAGNDVNKKEALELEYTKKKDELGKKREEIDNAEYANRIAIAQGTANALGALSELVGKDTLAGKALGISQALINTYVGASEAIKQKSTLPSPFDVITKVVNVATIIATGLKTVREITAVTVPTVDVPEVRIRKALGGVLSGPSHAMGGITTPFGELEGGEYVVNKTATQLFRPQLDQINGVGGNVDYQQSGFSGNITTSGQQPIIKTYVVASEMSSQQEMDRVIKDRSKI